MTRFKEMEEGETGYPMAREDRETAVTEGGRRVRSAKRAEEVVGALRRPERREGAGSAGQRIHPPEKEAGQAPSLC